MTLDLDLILELVEGGDLLDYILTRGGLGESTVSSGVLRLTSLINADEAISKHITYQICEALTVSRISRYFEVLLT